MGSASATATVSRLAAGPGARRQVVSDGAAPGAGRAGAGAAPGGPARQAASRAARRAVRDDTIEEVDSLTVNSHQGSHKLQAASGDQPQGRSRKKTVALARIGRRCLSRRPYLDAWDTSKTSRRGIYGLLRTLPEGPKQPGR